MRTLVLLGAGASVPAGLPTALSMGELIGSTDDFFAGRYGCSPIDYASAVKFARDQLIERRSHRSGASPVPDVEAIVNAVRFFDVVCRGGDVDDFATYESPEFAAFVSEYASRPVGREHTNASLGHHNPFERVYERSLWDVRRLTQLDLKRRLDYLNPLLDNSFRKPPVVATLNYDCSVEQAALDFGVTVDTGFAAWAKTRELAFDDRADLRLLKLHGSNDWFRSFGGYSKHDGGVEIWHEQGIEFMRREGLGVDIDDHAPALLFGGKNKLTSQGPYLQLMAEFERQIAQVERLVVVGYSFRDAHINALIRAFSLRRGNRETMVVVDPGVETMTIGYDVWPRMTPFHFVAEFGPSRARNGAK